MARFDRDDVLVRTDLASLLDELCGPREGDGRRSRWHCPVPEHADVHPSVTMSLDRRGVERWRCWSQSHGGTAIDALVAARGVSIREAIEELAQRSGVTGEGTPAPRIERSPVPERVSEELSDAAMLYALTCQSTLWTPIGRPVLDYLVDERGIDPDVLKLNRVGADPGFVVVARQAGLPKGGPRAVFPALSLDRHVTYFQVRSIAPDPDRPKYLNPPGANGSNPGYGWTVPANQSSNAVVICEGFPDAYIANCAGYAAIAVLGASRATPALADRIAPDLGARPVILAFDGDPAGRGAATKLGASLWRHGIMAVDFLLPSGADLNSWVNTARQLAPRIGTAVPDRPTGPGASTPMPPGA